MRISWQLRMTTLLVILSSRKHIALCQNTKVCSFNQMCTCRMEKPRSEVMCVRVPFYKLPDLLPEQYAHINVMSSNLEIIENDAFGMAQVESLRLMNNHIMFLEHRAFSSMENVLRSLDLSYNKLTSFPSNALRTVNHLDWLNLHSNEISAVDTEEENFRSWSRLQETLQTLYLSDNDISAVPEDTLNLYKRLTWLNVDLNELRKLPATNLPITLRTLSYCQNYIQDFPLDVLEKITDLSRLYVRGNYLTQFPLHLIRSPRRLDKLDLGENFIAFSNNTNVEHVLTIRELHLDGNRIRSLPSHCFRGSSIDRLYLSRNDMDTVDEQAFVDLANTLEYLDLENNNLQQIPTALNELKRLKYLYISSNGIANVNDTVMERVCPSLIAVSLAGNRLTRVPKSGLRKCAKMSHLDLGYNRVQEVNEQDFQGWGSALDTLLLRNNRISGMAAHTFKQTPRLRELNLSFNKMTSVDENAFAELRLSLESLELSFNLFQEEFAGEFLKPLAYLVWLALDNNNIDALTANVFHPLRNLQYLNLDTNSLTDIPTGLLSPKFHKHIEDVRFSNNHLNALRARTFVDLPQLQNIILSRNQVRKVESKCFANLPNAIQLILSGNRIEKIESQAFVDMPNLMKIDLQHNRLAILQLSSFVNVSGPTTSLSLNVSSNELREIVLGFTSANTPPFHLKYLDASANNLQNVPHALLTLCAHAIIKLELSFNRISKINENAFRNLTQLEVLALKSNLISFVHNRGFLNLATLQILDLSDNRIDYLHGETFHSIKNLRILNLGKNKLRTVSRDLFASTTLESVDLSNNLLGVLPSLSISKIGNTLRKLDLSNNHIEHLDSTMLANVPALCTLNLAGNKLSILPDNVFTSVGNLLTLDLSVNPLRANFKELFHYVQKLRNLNLAETGLHEIPHLPLPNLVSLRLSHNRLEKLYSASVENLMQLRRLYLDNNRLRALPSNVWQYLVLLKELDISNNPIRVLSKEGLLKLPRLQSLNIQYLKHLERFDVDSFAQNKLLTNLRLDTYPTVDKNKFHLGKTLSSVRSLRTLSVRVLEEELDDQQLVGSFHPKLKEVEITGSNLRYIHKGALKGIEQTYDLVLRIRNTRIEDFPIGLFEGIQQITHLSLDLSNNRLVALSPAVLYSNVTNWENVGTKLLDGGLILKDNPWSCDCGLVWLGHWLRRWLREAVEIHTLMITEAQQIENMAREATCIDQRTNQRISIVDLYPEDLSCQASALSRDNTSSDLLGNHLLGCLIKTVSIISLTKYLWAI